MIVRNDSAVNGSTICVYPNDEKHTNTINSVKAHIGPKTQMKIK